MIDFTLNLAPYTHKAAITRQINSLISDKIFFLFSDTEIESGTWQESDLYKAFTNLNATYHSEILQ